MVRAHLRTLSLGATGVRTQRALAPPRRHARFVVRGPRLCRHGGPALAGSACPRRRRGGGRGRPSARPRRVGLEHPVRPRHRGGAPPGAAAGPLSGCSHAGGRRLAMIVLADIGVLASPRETWEAWSPEPTLLAAIVFVGVLYGRGVRVVMARSIGARTKAVSRAWAYYAGLLALGLALVSPLDAFAGVLFSLHMVQHLVLIAVAAPLLVFGRPLRIAFLAIPRRLRGVVTRVTTRGRARGVLVRIVDPRLALVVHVLVLTMWHWPPIYASALRRPELHAL